MSDLIDRCTKLRALTRSPNVNEATAAMGQLHRLMTENGLRDADLDETAMMTVLIDRNRTFSRRSLALTAAVSRGCQITETTDGLNFVGPTAAVRSARLVYNVLMGLAEAGTDVPAGVLRKLASHDGRLGQTGGRQATGSVEAMRCVCREYFEMGLFDGVQAQLTAPTFPTETQKKAAPPVSPTQFVENYTTEKIQDDLQALDDKAVELIEQVAPYGRAEEFADELKTWAFDRGKTAGMFSRLPSWSPPPVKGVVKGLLMATSTVPVEKPRKVKALSSRTKRHQPKGLV